MYMYLQESLEESKIISVKPRENPNFLKKGKMIILVKIRKFSR